MGKVILDMAMSLDGFTSGVNGEDVGLYNWYFAPAPKSEAVIEELLTQLGALIMGKGAYETGEDQMDAIDDNPYKMAHFVLTHHPQDKIVSGPISYTFVTDGIESALKQAKAAAGDKDIAIAGGADIAQQYLAAGLVEEIQLHLAPLLVGKGKRLFDNLDIEIVELESTRVIDSTGVTHLKYRVVK